MVKNVETFVRADATVNKSGFRRLRRTSWLAFSCNDSDRVMSRTLI